MVFAFVVFTACGDSNKNEEELKEIESIFDHIAMESELNSKTESESESESETETETETESQEKIGEHLYVVIPELSSAELSSKAQKLVDEVADKTGLLTTLKYDNVHTSSPTGTCEILLGNTNRLESQNAIVLLKENDYICRWDTSKLVICGGSDGATVEAVQRFITEIVPTSTQYSLMGKNSGFEQIDGIVEDTASNEDEATVLDSTINGYCINEFSIVYDSNNRFGEKMMAEILRDVIKSRSGYLLDVISSEKITDKTVKMITLSVDERVTSGIENINGNIELKGANGYTLSIVVSEFIEDIDESTDNGVITLTIDKKINASKTFSDIRLMTYFVKKLGDAQSLLELLDVLALDKNDVYVIANIDEKLYENVSRNLPKGYTIYKAPSFSKGIAVVYKVGYLKNISAKSKEHSLDLEFELSDGEKLRYSYFVNVDSELASTLFDSSMPKTICFFENADSFETFGLKTVIQGNSTLNYKAVNYKMMIGDFICEDTNSLTVKNTYEKLSCFAKIYINVSDRLLNLYNSLE